MSTAQDLGFALPKIHIESTTRPNRRRACFRTRKILEGIVYDTVALEGNPFTFPEVQTLMDGITVGGHKVRDAEQVLNQAESWKKMLDEVEAGEFVPLSKSLESALRLHSLVSRNEALEWGKLRTGQVGIAGTNHQPPKAEDLERVYRAGARALERIENTHMKAMATFLFTARNQLFWDGNKRTGRLLMNGELLAAGHDAITVPAKRRQEFNTRMVRFYDTADASEMVDFLSGCSLEELRAGQPRETRATRTDPDGPEYRALSGDGGARMAPHETYSPGRGDDDTNLTDDCSASGRNESCGARATGAAQSRAARAKSATGARTTIDNTVKMTVTSVRGPNRPGQGTDSTTGSSTNGFSPQAPQSQPDARPEPMTHHGGAGRQAGHPRQPSTASR